MGLGFHLFEYRECCADHAVFTMPVYNLQYNQIQNDICSWLGWDSIYLGYIDNIPNGLMEVNRLD